MILSSVIKFAGKAVKIDESNLRHFMESQVPSSGTLPVCVAPWILLHTSLLKSTWSPRFPTSTHTISCLAYSIWMSLLAWKRKALPRNRSITSSYYIVITHLTSQLKFSFVIGQSVQFMHILCSNIAMSAFSGWLQTREEVFHTLVNQCCSWP